MSKTRDKLTKLTLIALDEAAHASNGSLTLTVENDVFTSSDNNYSHGVGVPWVSGAADVHDEGYTTYASTTLVQEINIAAFGNNFAGVSCGIYGEIGWNLVDTLAMTALRSDLNAASMMGIEPQEHWSLSFFGELGPYGVAHYLPLDGTLFRDRKFRRFGTRHRHGLLWLLLTAQPTRFKFCSDSFQRYARDTTAGYRFRHTEHFIELIS